MPNTKLAIALAQINPNAGDLQNNAAKIVEFCKKAQNQGAELVVFSELALTAYTCRDLFDRPAFIHQQLESLRVLAKAIPPELCAIVGCVTPRKDTLAPPYYNSAAVLLGGSLKHLVHKQLLPTYDVFDELRYFAPGPAAELFEFKGHRLGISICEDLWSSPSVFSERDYGHDPVQALVNKNADILINISGSPFYVEKHQTRLEVIAKRAAAYKKPLVYVNQVGGQDELMFDGMSCAFDAEGKLIARAKSFEEDICLLDLSKSGAEVPKSITAEQALFDALCCGLRDYVRKSSFEKVILGVSGGIDSAVCAALATEALGKSNVLATWMPTRYTAKESFEDAELLVRNLGIAWLSCDIDPLFQDYLDKLTPWLDQLAPATEAEVTFENIQARIRGQVLMALANRDQRLVLTTGNKSELATGYCTLYGDTVGALAVIGDVLKTEVYGLAGYINQRGAQAVIPARTLSREPTAELRANQRDQDTLPPYPVLDDILKRYLVDHEAVDTIIESGVPKQTVHDVLRRLVYNEYKRRQLPPALVVSRKAFGLSRRMPLTSRWY